MKILKNRSYLFTLIADAHTQIWDERKKSYRRAPAGYKYYVVGRILEDQRDHFLVLEAVCSGVYPHARFLSRKVINKSQIQEVMKV